MQNEYLLIGEIVKPQGIRGEVKIKALTNDMNRCIKLETVYLDAKGGYEPRSIVKGRCNEGFAYLLLEGVKDRNEAELLRGRKVYVERALIELDEDENFICELIGLEAQDTQGNVIGELVDVLQPNQICDVYVFDTERGELMIPALRRVVLEVDAEAGVMVLDENVLPEVAVWQDEPAERDE